MSANRLRATFSAAVQAMRLRDLRKRLSAWLKQAVLHRMERLRGHRVPFAVRCGSGMRREPSSACMRRASGTGKARGGRRSLLLPHWPASVVRWTVERCSVSGRLTATSCGQPDVHCVNQRYSIILDAGRCGKDRRTSAGRRALRDACAVETTGLPASGKRPSKLCSPAHGEANGWKRGGRYAR